MDKIQLFFQNFYAMTFDGKSAFWIGCAAILVIALVYMFSSKVRDAMKKSTKLLLVIPVLALVYAVWAVIGANNYVPLSQRTGETAFAYQWESTTQSSKANVEYTTDVKDPKTGEAYVQKYKFKELKNDLQRDGSNGYASQAITLTSTDETTEITFNPDGTYTFRALSGGAEETGEYLFQNKVLTLSNASGNDAFRKNISAWFANNLGWVVFFALVLASVILAFIYNDQIRLFLKKHPLVWLLIPAALLIYFVYVAIGWNIWVSVSDWADGDLTASYGWGGFRQYTKMFGDESFWAAVLNTLKLFAIIPICLLLGLGMALVMDQGLRGTPVFRTLILLPFALSFVVTGLIWQQMYNGNGGILVEFFKLFGVDGAVNWTSNEMIMYSIMIVMIWQFSGYVAVIFLAAIKNVSTSIINAAKLDGAYMPRIYWKMVIPQLKGAMGSCITILAMYALRSFDLIYTMTGLTNTMTATLPIMMYNQMYAHDNFAYAAAISCFLLAMVLVLILPLTYLTNRRK